MQFGSLYCILHLHNSRHPALSLLIYTKVWVCLKQSSTRSCAEPVYLTSSASQMHSCYREIFLISFRRSLICDGRFWIILWHYEKGFWKPTKLINDNIWKTWHDLIFSTGLFFGLIPTRDQDGRIQTIIIDVVCLMTYENSRTNSLFWSRKTRTLIG